jgi:carbamoyltransferase
MKVLGISPLDKDATVSLVEDGRVLFAAGEERFSRIKHHAGFPEMALEAALRATGTRSDEIDLVVYPFLDADQEIRMMTDNMRVALQLESDLDWRAKLRQACRPRSAHDLMRAPGLALGEGGSRARKLKALAYGFLGVTPYVSRWVARKRSYDWLERAAAQHRRWQAELEANLRSRRLLAKLQRAEHHLSHAANAYYGSGCDRALILTLDGYGSGLSGQVSLGEGIEIRRLASFLYPNSLGTFYEDVTSALGFVPDRHAGKIVGLAAYGDPSILSSLLLDRIAVANGGFRILQPHNCFFARYLASQFAAVDVAAAYQHALETVARAIVRHWIGATGCDAVVLSGGVAANVKMNQRIFEVEGVRSIFIYPNMGDGGCATGLALHACRRSRAPEGIRSVYYGPQFTDRQIEQALDAENMLYERPHHLAAELARLLHQGWVVARFDGRLEYGPRALGNRSILYHGRDPTVNAWLNQRLRRSEFMPFAPVTLWEDRHRYYRNLAGAEHAAEFMTITFECTEQMMAACPAAVHVDGTARPQLIKREVNPGYYDLIAEYRKITGVSTMINTSFNIHEEPIVCTPADALRAFLDSRLDALAIGPYLVRRPGAPSLGPDR